MGNSRALVDGDVPVLAALDALCFGEEAWSEEQIKGSLSLPTTKGHGWFEGETMVAFYLVQTSGDETEILTIGVHPSHRRAGLGRQMIGHILAAQAVGMVFLDVACDNMAARRLYEGAGFMPFGFRPRYYQRQGKAVDAINYSFVLNG
ncbi:MAG: GNAT family N-acetyltransferase [Bdellovibrionales bacterium]|jgi:ribosomal-protein-alanine N-acetyltransferase